MSNKIWINGLFKDSEDANTHILTHALHYATAVFEGIRCYKTVDGPSLFKLEDHINRLYNSAKIYFMDVPFTKLQIIDVIKDLVKINALSECYIRPLIYYDQGKMGVNPLTSSVSVAIALWEWNEYFKNKHNREGINLKISSWCRIDNRTMPIHAKASANYANSALARMEAIKSGFDEALMINTNGMIVEASAENIFVLINDKLITPPVSSGALDGITRKCIIEIAKNLDIDIEIKDIAKDEIYSADEVFLTGTASEIKPVSNIDHRIIGKGSIGELTKRLVNEFDQIKIGNNKMYRKWLTPIH